MNNSFQFKSIDPYVWNKLNDLFNGNMSSFPCLFAISSFNKGAMRISVMNDTGAAVVKHISNDLVELSKYLSKNLIEPELSLVTYLAVIDNAAESNDSFDETRFLCGLLQDLYKIDPERWPNNKTKNTNDAEFEFYHNGMVWFPVLLSPSHRSSIRRSPFLMVAFQPGRTFDYNKTVKKNRYDVMRKSIHHRIDDFYKNNRPHYLSDKSSGKNICQYIGYDKTESDQDFVYEELEKNDSLLK